MLHQLSCSICVPLSHILISLDLRLTKRFRRPRKSCPNDQMLFHLCTARQTTYQISLAKTIRFGLSTRICFNPPSLAGVFHQGAVCAQMFLQFGQVSLDVTTLKQSRRCDWEANSFLQALHGDVWDEPRFHASPHLTSISRFERMKVPESRRCAETNGGKAGTSVRAKFSSFW